MKKCFKMISLLVLVMIAFTSCDNNIPQSDITFYIEGEYSNSGEKCTGIISNSGIYFKDLPSQYNGEVGILVGENGNVIAYDYLYIKNNKLTFSSNIKNSLKNKKYSLIIYGDNFYLSTEKIYEDNPDNLESENYPNNLQSEKYNSVLSSKLCFQGTSPEYPAGYVNRLNSSYFSIKNTAAYEGPIQWKGSLEMHDYPYEHSKTRSVTLKFYGFDFDLYSGQNARNIRTSSYKIDATMKFIKDDFYGDHNEIVFNSTQAEYVYNAISNVKKNNDHWAIVVIDTNNPRSSEPIYTLVYNEVYLTNNSLWSVVIPDAKR